MSTDQLVFKALSFEKVLLGYSQDERAAGPTAATAHISRIPAGSVDRHIDGSRRGDHGGSNRELQLRTACNQSVQIASVDGHNGGRNKISAIHIEHKALLHFSQRNRAGGKGSDDRGWPSASAQRIKGVARLEDQQGERKHTERLPEGADSFHRGSYHRPE
jgi:hypothetical protein